MMHPTDTIPVATHTEADAPQGELIEARRSASGWTTLTIVAYAFVVIVAWAGLQLWGLGKAPFHTKGEPREALVVWEMTHGGGWILPKRNGVELPSKPPLFHWLGALTSLARGATDEWSIRFPSAALSLLALLCVFATGGALWSARAGLFSALALMTMFEWARAATNARVDMALTFGLQLALLSLLFFLRRRAAGWLVPLYIGITLAVLGKGPVGAVLPGGVCLIMLLLNRDLSALRQMRLGTGALVVGVGAGSWYVMALLLGGWAFFRKQVLAENLFTFLDNPEFGGGHRHPAMYLVGALLLGLLPWTLFLPGVAARLWRARRQLSAHDPRVYLLVWIAVVFGFYAIAASKRSVYLLGLYPAVALLLGWWWDEQSRAAAPDERWLARLLSFIAVPLTAILGSVLVVVLLEGLGAPILAAAQRWLPAPAQPFGPWVSEAIRTGRWGLLAFVASATGASYACIRAGRAANWNGLFAALFCTLAALLLAGREVFLPGIASHLSARGLMANVRQVVGPAKAVSFYKTLDYGAVFYWGDHIRNYNGPLPDGEPEYLLIERQEWERIRDTARGQYEAIGFPDDEKQPSPERLMLVRRVEAR